MRLVGGFRLLALGAAMAFAAPLVVACNGGDDGVGPHIERVVPSEAAPGGAVEIIGKRFCGDGDVAAEDGTCNTPPVGSVSLGVDADVVRATVVEWKHERITVDVPQSAPAGATLIVVTVGGVASNAVEFEVL